jgi:Arc/MetJ family transcription regulator
VYKKGAKMKRTNIVIDEKLVEKGKKVTGLKTNKSVVDFALKELIRHSNQKRILELLNNDRDFSVIAQYTQLKIVA